MQGAGGDQNRIEQLMVNMLDERDKLLEQLQVSDMRLWICPHDLTDSLVNTLIFYYYQFFIFSCYFY